jgi:hypothetical protein
VRLAGVGAAARLGLPKIEGTCIRWGSRFTNSGKSWRQGGAKSMPESSRWHSAPSIHTERADRLEAAPMRKPCADGSMASFAGQACGVGSASGCTSGYGAAGFVGPTSRR